MKNEPYRVVIVEDDPEQRELVAGLIKEQGGLIVVGLAGDFASGLKILNDNPPDLVILDVLLPPHNCFDLLSALGEVRFRIIFTTSHDAYAVRAFRLSAIDYLLKPLDRAEFSEAIQKFKILMARENQGSRIQILLENFRAGENGLERVALPTITGFQYVPVRDIIRCESFNTYTTVHTVDKKKLVISRTLKECESQLQNLNFFRVHNSHLVNLKHVVEYLKGEGGMVRLIDGSTVDVSRRRRDEFLRRFSTL